MTEEPFRWVEAIANRRDYIDGRLATGGPIVALSCHEGILLLTYSRDHQKLFEIYDRIAMGAMGHPGDIERLRVTTIELASTEGFTRSPHDVSLRRLMNFGLSPMLKAAFEQIYGAPLIARFLFAELGYEGPGTDLLSRLDYDGSVVGNGATFASSHRSYAVISGKERSIKQMEKLLSERFTEPMSLESARQIGTDALLTGYLSLSDDSSEELPTREQLDAEKARLEGVSSIEAALLDRNSRSHVTFRKL